MKYVNIVNIVNTGEDEKVMFWKNKKWRSVLGGKMRLPWELSSSKFKFVLPLSELTVTLDSPWHSLQQFLSLHCKTNYHTIHINMNMPLLVLCGS